MRILFISNYSDLYGANRSMMTIIEYLKRKGNDVFLILPEHGRNRQTLWGGCTDANPKLLLNDT